MTESQDDEYEINKIVKARYDKAGNLHYLIDWKGYPVSERTLNEAAKEYVSSHDIPTTGKQPLVNKNKRREVKDMAESKIGDVKRRRQILYRSLDLSIICVVEHVHY